VALQVVPRNSVGTPQLKRNAVNARKLAPNAVRSAHVLDSSLFAADFRPGQLPQGSKGDKGDKGDRGEPGPTEGVAAVDAAPGPTSVANQFPDSSNLLSTFTTSRAGRLLLNKEFNALMNCSTVPQAAWWWLTLDGAVVTSSLRITNAGPTTPFLPLSLSGVTAQSVPAGNHTLGVEAMCSAGTPSGYGAAFYSGGNAVVLG
jgi:hypothetical protein